MKLQNPFSVRQEQEIPAEFLDLISDILSNPEFLTLDSYSHHPGASRLVHSMNVSYLAWKMAKRRGYDERAAARIGLLHDFCPYDFEDRTPTGEHQAFYHPKAAAWTSEEQFGIDERVRSIILTHMFPLGPMPKCREAWVVTCADKLCASLELVRIPFALSWRQRVMVVTA